MKIFALMFTVAILVSGCAQPPASRQELSGLYTDWANCLAPYIKRSDDGISDATTVAHGVAGMCQTQCYAYFQAELRSENDRVKYYAWQKRTTYATNRILPMVLQMRVENKNQELRPSK